MTLHQWVTWLKHNRKLASLLDNHAPVRNKVVTLRPKSPWFTPEIKEQNAKQRRLESLHISLHRNWKLLWVPPSPFHWPCNLPVQNEYWRHEISLSLQARSWNDSFCLLSFHYICLARILLFEICCELMCLFPGGE